MWELLVKQWGALCKRGIQPGGGNIRSPAHAWMVCSDPRWGVCDIGCRGMGDTMSLLSVASSGLIPVGKQYCLLPPWLVSFLVGDVGSGRTHVSKRDPNRKPDIWPWNLALG